MTEEPYKVLTFATEEDWREYVGWLVGRRIAREQRKTEAALARVAALEVEVADLRSSASDGEGVGPGTPLY